MQACMVAEKKAMAVVECLGQNLVSLLFLLPFLFYFFLHSNLIQIWISFCIFIPCLNAQFQETDMMQIIVLFMKMCLDTPLIHKKCILRK
jgi:hypothetical protein